MATLHGREIMDVISDVKNRFIVVRDDGPSAAEWRELTKDQPGLIIGDLTLTSGIKAIFIGYAFGWTNSSGLPLYNKESLISIESDCEE